MTRGSRLRSLCRLSTIGLYFTAEKQEALLRGDTSNAVVNRNFVYGLQVIGLQIYGVPEKTPFMIQLQLRYVQMAMESLAQLEKTNQERTKVQALVSATHAGILAGFPSIAQLYLLRACKTMEDAKLRFLPEYGPPAELSDQVREDVSVLSQVIYLENYIFLTLGGAAPLKTVRIEKEFRSDLQVRTIWRFPDVGLRSVLASLPIPLRHMPINHANQKHSVGQRYNLDPRLC